MLVLGKYMSVVYSPGGCIIIMLVKMFKMAFIQDGRQDFELYRTERKTYLSWV